jgi:radical SAM superfamily enzyme YgiQ (UPF0313 family)
MHIGPRPSPKVKLVYPAQRFLMTETPRPDGSLGLLYIAGMLRREGIEVSLLDMGVGDAQDRLEDAYQRRVRIDDENVRVGISAERLKDKLAGYDVVGVTSIFTPQTFNAFEVAATAKEVNPEILTVAGGGNARALHRLFLDNGFDIVVFGEAEQAFVDICRRLEKGEGYEDIPNVAYKDREGEVVINPERPVVQDLDELPMPAWDQLPLQRYWEIGEPHGGSFGLNEEVRYLSMQTSRGCPYRCTYCHISKEGDAASLRLKSYDRVMAEIDRIKDLGAEYLFFEDDSLLAKRGRILKIFEGLRDKRLKIIDANGVNLSHFYRNDAGRLRVDTDLLDLMVEVGWVEVALPFESGSQRVIDRYASRKWNRQRHDVVDLVRECTTRKIRVYGFFTIGYPDETYDELTETVMFAQELVQAGLDSANFYIITPYPGSVLYDEAAAAGHLPPELDLANMKFQVPSMIRTTVPPEVLRYTRRIAYHLIHSQERTTRKAAGTVERGVAEQTGRLRELT